MTDQPPPPPSTDSPEEERAASSSSSGSEQVFRVNRKGQEVFSGPLLAFQDAIKRRKIRADDLIYDGEQQMWVFARSHPVFVELAAAGLQALIEQRRAKSRRRWLVRTLTYSLLFSCLIFFLSRYSRQIDFGNYVEPEEQLKAESSNSAEGEAAASAEAAGEGEGGEGGEGGEEIADEAAERGEKGQQEGESELELPFNLNQIQAPSDGRRNSLDSLSALSKDESYLRAESLYQEAGEGLDGYDTLLEAQSYAQFAFMTSRTQSQGGLEKSRELLKKIQEELRGRCAPLKGEDFCALQLREPRWPEPVVRAVLRREVLIGMSSTQAQQAWGDPVKIVQQGEGKRFCFDRRCKKNYLLLNQSVMELNFGPAPKRRRAR